MLTITSDAAAKLTEIMDSKGQQGHAVRFKIAGRGIDDFQYDFRSVPVTLREDHEQAIETGGLTVLISEQDADDLRGALIRLKEGGGFAIDNPNPAWASETGREIARLIEEKINPAVALHGGFIQLVDVKSDTAYIRMGGGCQGCSLKNLTLKGGVDSMIQQVAPGITQVIDVTRHELGVNPYYTGPIPQEGSPSPLT